jgi:hypothetical protein
MIQEGADLLKELVDTNWDLDYEKPQMYALEKMEQLRLEIYNQDVILFKEAPSGHRMKPRGRWYHYDELVVIECYVQSIASYDRFIEIANVLTTVIQQNFTLVRPTFQRVMVLGFSPILEETYQYWRGVLRVELQRYGICV